MSSNTNLHLQKLYNSLKPHTQASLSDFKKCFVNISVYDIRPNNTNVGNSRYVFGGMYAFKGILASIVLNYISGNGKQLQHFLGNAFSNDNLAKLFNDLEFEKVCKIHENLDLNNYKHVFAYAYLGFIVQHCNQEYSKKLAYKYFVVSNGHFLPKSVHLNPVSILKAKTQQVLGENIRIIQNEEENMFLFQILLTSGKVLSEHKSVSKHYAKKKAIKLATKSILEIESELPKVKAQLEKQKIAELEHKLRSKAEKAKTHSELIREKQTKRAIEKEKKRLAAKERDVQRVLNKKNRTNGVRKESDKEKILKELSDPNITSSKRRFLEDKLK